jgi:Protein of unknown function (DUF4236)
MRGGRFHGLRFQRRVKLFPGVDLNLSLSGVGVSAGGKGFHVGVTARGQKYVSVGLPGTGLSVRQYAPIARIGPSANVPRLNIMPVMLAIS